MGPGSVRLPGCVCIGKDGSDELFVGGPDVFLGVTVSCMSECSDDVQPGFGLGVYCVAVLFERHPSVEGHSKESGCVCDWDGRVVYCDMRLSVVFVGVWCNKCDRGFVCGYC